MMVFTKQTFTISHCRRRQSPKCSPGLSHWELLQESVVVAVVVVAAAVAVVAPVDFATGERRIRRQGVESTGLSTGHGCVRRQRALQYAYLFLVI